MHQDFKPRLLHRALGFLAFLIFFAAVMLLGAVVFALEKPLLAIFVLFVGVSLASFGGLLVTHRLCRKDLDAHKEAQFAAYVVPTERHQHR